MAYIKTTLHLKNDKNTDVYPNVLDENIPEEIVRKKDLKTAEVAKADSVDVVNKDTGSNANIVFQVGDGQTFAKTVNNVDHANNATNDVNGNAIVSTYATKTELSNEVNRATNKETELESSFNTEISNVKTSINDETSRATNKETEIETSLNNYKSSNDKALADEVTNRTSGDQTLTTSLNNEVSRATTKESELETSINNEVTRATQSETKLTSDLSNEVTNRTSGDSTLQTNIDNETSRATGKESSLETSVNNEVSRATNKESELETSINSEVTRATNKETELQDAIDAINNSQNFVATVATANDLSTLSATDYDTSDCVLVLQDENNSNQSAVYKWNGTAFTFVGTLGTSYTKSEVDNIINAHSKTLTIGTKTYNATQDVTIYKSDLGLGNVDNTADANKSVNYANSSGSAANVVISEDSTVDAATVKFSIGTGSYSKTINDVAHATEATNVDAITKSNTDETNKVSFSIGDQSYDTTINNVVNSSYSTYLGNSTSNYSYTTLTSALNSKQTKVTTLGSSTQPVYISSEGTFSTSNTYAGGTKVTLNGTDKGSGTASFYAPTDSGTTGQILKAVTNEAPIWINQTELAVGNATNDSDGNPINTTYWKKTDLINLSQLTNDVGYITSYVDTKNTAGATDTSSKIYLIGATSQTANPQTYSQDTAYIGTDGCLYSGGTKVLTSHQSLSNYVTKTSTETIAASTTGNAATATTATNVGTLTNDDTNSNANVKFTIGNKSYSKTINNVSNATSATYATYLGTSTSNYTKTTLDTALNNKQDKLTAGTSGQIMVSNGTAGSYTWTDKNTVANSLINSLTTGSSTPSDADYYVSQYAGGGTTTTTYHRRPVSALWSYMAGKIGSAGSATQPVYFSNGKPVATTYTLAKSVPSNAVFTDTTYGIASSTTAGLVKTGYTASGKNYAVQLDSNNKMYVNVPWTDANTTYTLTQDSTDGHKITLTPSSGTATTITIPDNNDVTSVSVNQTLTSGTEVGSITVNGTETKLYAPSGVSGYSDVVITYYDTSGNEVTLTVLAKN